MEQNLHHKLIKKPVNIYSGPELAAYGFPQGHPFGQNRHEAFLNEFNKISEKDLFNLKLPVKAERDILELFHTKEYIDYVQDLSLKGYGYLDGGDTPAFPGVFEAASFVAGSVINAIDETIQSGSKSFVPIAGLHHAYRDHASGFCVFNDCGVAIEYLFQKYNYKQVAYIDIDAHHGDGVYYEFEDNPHLVYADIHETGRSLFPGSGFEYEKGKNSAVGYKLNIEMNPGADDTQFDQALEKVMDFIENFSPEFIIFQCGADSLKNDPLTHLSYTENSHRKATLQIAEFANNICGGKMLAVGGGGYNLSNIAKAWCAVIESMASAENNI